MIFSERYRHALEAGKLKVELADAVRSKLAAWTVKFDDTVYVQRDPNNTWVDNSCVSAEVLDELLPDYGWTEVPGTNEGQYTVEKLKLLMIFHGAHRTLDVVEKVFDSLQPNRAEDYRRKVNEIMESHACPWRMQDGQVFKLDADFVGAQLTVHAYDALVSNSFAGAADEYAKARQELSTGDVKDAIFHACKSFESVLKVLTGEGHVNADKLLQRFYELAFLDDLPEDVRNGVARQVLMALPFLRNKLGGHGQGADIVNVPAAYGELAVQIAAAFHNFLLAKHIERKPKEEKPPEPEGKGGSDFDDQIPF